MSDFKVITEKINDENEIVRTEKIETVKYTNRFNDDLFLHTEDIEVDKKIKRDKDLRNSKIVNPQRLQEELDRQDEIFNTPTKEKDFREMYSGDKLNIEVNGETKNCR